MESNLDDNSAMRPVQVEKHHKMERRYSVSYDVARANMLHRVREGSLGSVDAGQKESHKPAIDALAIHRELKRMSADSIAVARGARTAVYVNQRFPQLLKLCSASNQGSSARRCDICVWHAHIF